MGRLICMICLALLLAVPQAGATSVAADYSTANRQTLWNNITDTMHTVGQTSQQAKSTKTRLHRNRTRTRLQNQATSRRKAWLNSK